MKEDFFSLVHRNNGTWYYYVYDKFGRRVYRSTGEKIKKHAMEVALARAKTGTLVDANHKTFKTFADYATGFWNYDTCPIIQDKIQRGGKYSRQHAKNYASILERVLLPEFGRKYLEELSTGLIQKWLVTYKSKNSRIQRFKDGSSKVSELGNKTINDYLICLRMILEQARLDGELEKNPAAEVRPLANDSKPHATFTSAQIHTLFKDRWDNLAVYAACLLSAKTGMRQGEVRALTLEQIHEDEGCIYVDASWNDADGRKTTKSGFSRVVPVGKDMVALLKAVAPMENGLVFTTNGRTPCSPNFFNEELDRQMDLHGIPKTDSNGLGRSFHSFRYFFNSRLVVANLSGEKIRSVIGHESSDMTEHYTRLTAEDLVFVREIQSKIG